LFESFSCLSPTNLGTFGADSERKIVSDGKKLDILGY